MRILITGVGLVSALGVGAEEVFGRVLAGERALGPVTLFDTSAQRCKLGAEVSGLDVASVAPRGQQERWSRTDAMALLAAEEALGQAGLRAAEVSLIVGGSTAGMFEGELLVARMHREPASCGPTRALVRFPVSSTADRLGEALGPFRRVRTVCSACSAGSNAILLGALWLRQGKAERVLVGASEGLCRLTFAGFDALAITDADGCRPFDARRRGMNLGEGAAFLVIETEASAQARGREPLAELAGWALGTEASHITQPEEDGATIARLVRAALARSGVRADEVDFVSAHGTGTARNDSAESAALRAALGEAAWVSSHKGQLGHTLAAAGAVGAVLTTLALRDGVAPPTGGLREPDPACAVRHVIGAPARQPLRSALVNAFGFGGLDTVLVLRGAGQPSTPGAVALAPGRVVISSAVSVDPVGVRGHRRLAADVPLLLAEGEPPAGGQATWEPAVRLDPERTRRVDRCARLVTVAFQEALREGGLAERSERVGGVAGSAFGAVAACAEHCARTEDARGRCVNPILFPNLVPSSPAANAAIYLGLRGPVMMTADLGISGEIAVHTAIDLLQGGEADAFCAAGHAELSSFTERLFDPLLLGADAWGAPRAEGAAAVLLEREDKALERGALPVARVVFSEHGSGDVPATLPPPRGRAVVVVPRPREGLTAALAALGWGDAAVLAACREHGDHEASGAQALSLAVAALSGGQADAALVLGSGPDRWSAFVLEAVG